MVKKTIGCICWFWLPFLAGCASQHFLNSMFIPSIRRVRQQTVQEGIVALAPVTIEDEQNAIGTGWWCCLVVWRVSSWWW